MVREIYVEKKENFRQEADSLKNDIENILGINGICNLHILKRYFIENISDETYENAKTSIFSEPPVDNIYEKMPDIKGEIFAVEYLPGQFDQRAKSAEECIRFIASNDNPKIKTATVYIIEGNVKQKDIKKIKNYLINPIESREADLDAPETLELPIEEPEKTKKIEGFRDLRKEDLYEIINDMGLAMDIEDLSLCLSYFKKIDRDPTTAEIKIIDTYWSDHCRHTTFNTTLCDINFEDEIIKDTYEDYLETRKELGINKPISLMNIATIAAKALKKSGSLDNLVESEEINACTVNFKAKINGEEEPWVLLFKNETHNHPTEIEPFGGAATCIGGAIRDPLSGRSYVYAGMRLSGAGDPLQDEEKTLKGKLPQRKISKSASDGYSSYGNQIGIATGIVDEIYHEGYIAKRMEVGAVVAAAPEGNIRRERPCAGDVVILLGGKTGRDGIGGATGSSKSHSEDSLKAAGAEVQKGNAPTERKIQRLFRNKDASILIKRCNDFGAGGVAVAIGELASGLFIELDKIPKKYEGLNGEELALSESQERMAVVVEAENAELFKKLAEEENLEASVVATVTDDDKLRMVFNGDEIASIDREFLDINGAERKAKVKVVKTEDYEREIPNNFADGMRELVSDLNICSKRGLSEKFDSTIGGNTVLMPFGGKYQRTPIQAMVHKIPAIYGETDTVSIMSYGFNPFITEKSPYHGAYWAIVESINKLISTGSKFNEIYVSLQEYFEKLEDKQEAWGSALAAILGAYRAQTELGIAAIGGKDSMSGTFEDIHVPPTLISFAITTDELANIITPEFKDKRHDVVLLKPEIGEDGLPIAESLINNYKIIEKLNSLGVIESCFTPCIGGVAEAIYKMAIGNGIGFEFNDHIALSEIFSYAEGSFILEISDEIDLKGKEGFINLGRTTARKYISLGNMEVSLEELGKLYEEKLENVYPTKTAKQKEIGNEIAYLSKNVIERKTKLDRKPKFLIPVFPGTNCEYDSARAVKRAGGEPKIFIVNNLDEKHLNKSVIDFAKEIETSEAIFIPGGFSGADEPDGSAKFITSFFRNDVIANATMNLIKERDGLIIGICNGFQALIKLGLLPYGEIMPQTENSPTLTFNDIGRHQSKLVRTRICSTKSPWLRNACVGQIVTVPISHGEGKFVASESDIDDMIMNGQIITQYVDLNGNPTMNIEYNPNGSIMAVEGIISPDGRVLGKMGHSERFSNGTYQNISGETDLGLFESAVAYFNGETLE